MAECYRCGVSDERERLFDAISNKGLIKICKNCSNDEGLPLIQPVDLNKPEKTRSVYERLSDMAKIDPAKHRSMLLEKAKQDSMRRYDKTRRPETTLKGVIDNNFEKSKPKPRTDLVPNFHWIIMRARRSKKLTQKQLAENIGEPESSIISAESGALLSNSDSLVRKLENYLGVKIRNVESPYASDSSRFVKPGINEDAATREARERFEKEGKFNKETAENLNISDLQDIDKEKGSEKSGGLFSFFKRKKKKQENPEDSSKSEEEISDEEADKILFGK